MKSFFISIASCWSLLWFAVAIFTAQHRINLWQVDIDCYFALSSLSLGLLLLWSLYQLLLSMGLRRKRQLY
ncbi:hypothetical protein [Dongshaea marina]|uniref:hypothetical protein n=1 Tax=Dongshaea marina TaxID=2047966 RepID=UPI000D3E49E8|nr:hypothetical protein [Dongshaea marina]